MRRGQGGGERRQDEYDGGAEHARQAYQRQEPSKHAQTDGQRDEPALYRAANVVALQADQPQGGGAARRSSRDQGCQQREGAHAFHTLRSHHVWGRAGTRARRPGTS
jgi:hypothetical protein